MLLEEELKYEEIKKRDCSSLRPTSLYLIQNIFINFGKAYKLSF